MKGIEAYRQALTAAGDLQWAEINAQTRESLMVGVSQGKITRTDANAQTVFYVRASAGRAGYAYTQDPMEDASAVLRRAAENGLACEEERRNELAQAEKRDAEALPQEADIEEMTATANAMTGMAAAADTRVVQAAADVRMDTLETRVLNTRGLDVGMARRVYAAEISVMAAENGQQVNASAQITSDRLQALDLSAAAERAIWQASMQFEQRELKPGLYPVVLDSSVVINIFTTAWQLFSAAKYIDGSSAVSGRLGDAIASPALTITDRPAWPGCGYRFLLDDEGCSGQAVELIRQGTLAGLMHTQATAAAMNASPTGNSGRVALLTGSIPTELIVVPKVFCVEPGNATRESLLQTMGDGVWITRSFDVFHSVNVGSGDFAIPCSGAVVKDGRPAYNVGGLTLCGNLLDLASNIVEVANDLWIDEFLLKSYCVGAPSMLVSTMQVNGRG